MSVLAMWVLSVATVSLMPALSSVACGSIAPSSLGDSGGVVQSWNSRAMAWTQLIEAELDEFLHLRCMLGMYEGGAAASVRAC